MISFGFWFHFAFSTTIFSFCVISVGFLLFSFLIYEHHVHEGTSHRRTHQRPMEWHHHLLSNHRNDKSKDDNNIYDNDENNVVGPTKRPWNANNFYKNWAQKTWYQSITEVISKIGMRSGTHFSTRICYFAVKWFVAKIVERLSHNKSPKPLLALNSKA